MHSCPAEQLPQLSVPPQPLGHEPQDFPNDAQVAFVQHWVL
jgi:hypothetical protein